jgi:hypothetical protein
MLMFQDLPILVMYNNLENKKIPFDLYLELIYK